MLEAVKVALDPTPEQARLLLMSAGAARFAHNACLEHVKECLESGEPCSWSFYSLRKWFNSVKDAIAPWWREVSKEALASGCRSCAEALKNWGDSKAGRRKGRKVGFPRFKGKSKAKPTFAYTTGSFGLVEDDPKALKLPRIGRVHCFEDAARRCGGAAVKSMTVSCQGGRWFASLLVERADPPKWGRLPKGRVGCDLGVKALATLSDGTVVENPKPLQGLLDRLAKAQRKLARCKKGSRRRAIQRAKVARVQARAAQQRSDALHKLTTMLASTYSEVVIEDLNVSGMGKSHALARSVADASFAEIRRQLEYKARRTGCKVTVADRWFPSTKTCSRCGHVQDMPLSERTYRCPQCGLVLDRDANAAKNLEAYSDTVAGSAPETLNAHGAGVRPAAVIGRGRSAVKCEPKAGS